jgi:hypothetical protein
MYLWEHNGLTKNGAQKSDFFGPKFFDMWPASESEFAYFCFI